PMKNRIAGCCVVLFFSLTAVVVAQRPRPKILVLEGWGNMQNSAYEITLDKENKVSGEASLHVKGRGSNRDYFSLYQGFKADVYRGTRLQYSGQIKTKEVQDPAHPNEKFARAFLWLLIHNADGQQLVNDDMVDRSLRGTNDWTRREIV